MNFFSYESKPMQLLMQLGDLIILNLLYLLCCIPIFTIGAAQAGLYSGVKTMQDPEDDTYVTTAFFKGFASGFLQISIAWVILTVVTVVLGMVVASCAALYYQGEPGALLSMIVSIIAFCILATFQSVVTVFHSRFSCTAWQLLRNVWFLTVAHPIRSLGVAIMTWGPLLFYGFAGLGLFMTLTPIWLAIYYSGAFSFAYTFMKKPFQTLIDHYNEEQEAAAKDAAKTSEEIEETEE